MRSWQMYGILILIIAFGVWASPATAEIRVITPQSLVVSEEEISSVLDVDFTAAPTSGRAPLMVQFFDISNGNPVQWFWDFGDGDTSRVENPIHTYSQGGVYSVQLTVHNGAGESASCKKEQFITARPVPLICRFTAEPDSGPAPLTVKFTDRSDGSRVWLWNFGDGSQASMIPDPVHTFVNAGEYAVTLTVSNELGITESCKQVINVTSSDTVRADFSASPTSGPAPLTVRFSDQSSGPVVAWSWDFGDGTAGSTSHPTHTYQNRGVYPVTLTVSSSDLQTSTLKKEDYISVTYSPSTGSLPLSPGWNFVSVPQILIPGSDTAAIFAGVDSGGHSAFMFDSSSGGWIPLTRNTPVQPMVAYWIYSTRTDTVPLSFDRVFGPVSSRYLVKGWNAAGFTGLQSREARTALVSVQESWQNCIGFNPSLQRYDEMIFKGINDDIVVSPYRGYWVYMSSDGILSG